MEVNVQCPCGQRFEFEVEPVNGQMPCEVACPTCGADGTALANAFIQEKLAAGAPAPVAAPVAAPAYRINRPASPGPAAAAPSPAYSMPAQSAPAARKPAKAKVAGDGFLKGVLGALIGGFIGMMGWFLLIKGTGYAIGYAAWGVGALTGVGARVVGAESSQRLGSVTAVFALIAIIGGQFLAVRSIAGKEFEKMAIGEYQKEVNEANSILAMKTDDEIKAYLAKEEGKNPSAVTAEEITEFKEKTIPACRALVAGKPSQSAFVSKFMSHMNRSFGVQWEILKASFGVFTILWILLGVASAYKLGAGAED